MDETTPTTRVRRRLLAACMVAAPLLIILGQGLGMKDTDNARLYVSRFAAHPNRYYAADLIAGVGMLLLVPAAVGIIRTGRGCS